MKRRKLLSGDLISMSSLRLPDILVFDRISRNYVRVINGEPLLIVFISKTSNTTTCMYRHQVIEFRLEEMLNIRLERSSRPHYRMPDR